jgi:hypothetical protein
MDTHWFAVDAVGHVALFDSGENGHVPTTASDASYIDDLIELAGSDPADSYQRAAQRLGFFRYDHDSYAEPIEPYRREDVPAIPIHVDQLPPAIRAGCQVVRFAGVEFSRADLIQPIEHGPCRFWYTPDLYVAADGRTVRPVPGQEARYPAAVAEFRAQYPDQAARYTFEGPTDGA